MFRSIDGFLKYFDAVNRRAVRDIGALPQEADGWTPPAGEGEHAWSINQIVGHMAGSRLYFASAYHGEGWIFPPAPDVSSRERWVPALEESATVFRACLGRAYSVTEVDEHGHLVLDVSADIDARFGGSHNDIRVEAPLCAPRDGGWIAATEPPVQS